MSLLTGAFLFVGQYCVISSMKHLWLILLLVSCTTAPKINYKGDVNDEGKYHGKGVITYPNGEKYVGEFYNNSYDGKGVLFNYYQFE
jgi:hypothetical protein